MKSKKSLNTLIAAAILFISFSSARAQVADTSIVVNGVCEMCKFKIDSAAQLSGVSYASWDVESKILHLKYDPAKVSLNEINASVNKSGYDSEFSAANEEAYNNLHRCCRYRDPDVVNDHR